MNKTDYIILACWALVIAIIAAYVQILINDEPLIVDIIGGLLVIIAVGLTRWTTLRNFTPVAEPCDGGES